MSESDVRRVLVTGAAGQLGVELGRTRPADVELTSVDADLLDVTDVDAVRRLVDERRPHAIVNAAAYTAVDRAESEEELAAAVNGRAPGHLASAARSIDARFVQISTDFVFDGTSGAAYRVDDPPAPLSAYGRTKLAGERAALEALPTALVLRTAWVYASHGGNFVRTMLRLMGERGEVRVVDDQIGTPTWARHLAQAVWRGLDRKLVGVHHFTNAGVATWYDFAEAIADLAVERGLLESRPRVLPIPSSAFPTPARRPSCGVLDRTGTWEALDWTPPHWRAALASCLDLLAPDGTERPGADTLTATELTHG